MPTRDPSLVREAPDSLGGNRPGQVQNHFCSERHLHIVYHVCFSKGKSKISFTYAKNVLQQIILGPTLQLICMVWGVTIRCWRGRRSERAEIRIFSSEKPNLLTFSRCSSHFSIQAAGQMVLKFFSKNLQGSYSSPCNDA